jgi:cytochrome c5
MAFKAVVVVGAVLGLAVTAAVAYAQDLPEGPGKAEFVASCGNCHSLDQATSQRHNRDEWGQKVDSMRSFGAEGSQETFVKIADYLFAHYGDAPPPAAAAPAAAAN